MADVYLVSPNPYDFSADELEEVADIVRAAEPDLEIEAGAHPERGYGVSTYEVIDIVSTVGGAGSVVVSVTTGLNAVIKWARARWTRDREEHPDENPRPRLVRVLYGPTGEVLLRVAIDEPDGEPEEVASDHPRD